MHSYLHKYTLCVHVSILKLVSNCSILNVKVMIQQKGHKKKTEPQPEKWESWATSWKSQSAVPTCTLLTVPFLPLASAQIHNLHSLFPIGDVLIHMTSLRKRRRRKGISVSNVTSFAFYSPQIKCSKEFLQIAHYTFDVNWSFRGLLCSSQSSLLTSPCTWSVSSKLRAVAHVILSA